VGRLHAHRRQPAAHRAVRARPAKVIPIANARHIPEAGPALDLSQYHDLWLYLGARDPRVTRACPETTVFDLALGVCALVDPTAGTAWIHRDGAITVAGTPEIGDQLAALIG
jgi:protein-L-isoaspartate(D-aspartate) O-methyltransferase